MKKLPLALIAAVTCVSAVAGLWAVAQISTPPQPLARWMPAGALFYLESADFSAQLRDWNRSDTQTKWLASKNHEQFVTTRLMLKLKDAFDEFSSAAGFAPNLDALQSFAGSDSAIAVYDIGKLALVYISRLPTAQLGQNSLTRVRANYQSRTAAGQTYYVRQAGERTAAFATVGDFVLVSTREDLLAQALELTQGTAGPASVSQDKWYEDAVAAMGDNGKKPVDLRLVMDLPRVIESPYFRSYWIQRNRSDFRTYSAFLAQVTRTADEFNESRVFVRSDEATMDKHDAAVVDLQKYVPDNAGLFRLWDTSSPDFALDLIREKIFASAPSLPASPQNAPTVAMTATAGSESDLHTRIDEPPKQSLAGALSLDSFKSVINAAGLQAVLHIESSASLNDNTFVDTDVALALRAGSSWNAVAVKSALTDAVASYQSVGSLGLQWHDISSAGRTLSQWDGLIPLTIYVDGPTLWLAKTPTLLSSALNRSASVPSSQSAVYLARYNHRTELSSYLKLMRMLDLSDQANYSNFFSENIGSLASSLDSIQSVSVRVNESPLVQHQEVRYGLSR